MFLPLLNFYNLLILFFSFQNGRQFFARLVLFNLILQESTLIILNSLFVDSGNRDTQHLFFHIIFLQTLIKHVLGFRYNINDWNTKIYQSLLSSNYKIQHAYKCIAFCKSFCKNRVRLLISLFYAEGDWDFKKLSNLTKVP